MNRKLGFWSYGLLVMILFWLVPWSFPLISPHAYAGLFFGYTEQPFYLMIFSVIDLLFDYVSLSLPQSELLAIRSFELIRKPRLTRRYMARLEFILPYFIPFLMTKLLTLAVWQHPLVWLWLGLSGLTWHLLLLLTTTQPTRVSNGLSLSALIAMRVLAHFWF